MKKKIIELDVDYIGDQKRPITQSEINSLDACFKERRIARTKKKSTVARSTGRKKQLSAS